MKVSRTSARRWLYEHTGLVLAWTMVLLMMFALEAVLDWVGIRFWIAAIIVAVTIVPADVAAVDYFWNRIDKPRHRARYERELNARATAFFAKWDPILDALEQEAHKDSTEQTHDD